MPFITTSDPNPATPLRNDIRNVVVATIPSARSLADDDSLFERADADSLSFIALLRAVELRYGLSLIATDLLLSDFSSIGAIARYVAGRVASDEWGETGI